MKRMKTSNYAILPSSRLYTLIAIVLYANPLQVLGSKPVLWEFDRSGHSPRNNNSNNKDLTIEIQCL
jgi:hypothetical protein